MVRRNKWVLLTCVLAPLLSLTFVESCHHVIGCRFPDPLRAVTKGLGDDAEKESHDYFFSALVSTLP